MDCALVKRLEGSKRRIRIRAIQAMDAEEKYIVYSEQNGENKLIETSLIDALLWRHLKRANLLKTDLEALGSVPTNNRPSKHAESITSGLQCSNEHLVERALAVVACFYIPLLAGREQLKGLASKDAQNVFEFDINTDRLLLHLRSLLYAWEMECRKQDHRLCVWKNELEVVFNDVKKILRS